MGNRATFDALPMEISNDLLMNPGNFHFSELRLCSICDRCVGAFLCLALCKLFLARLIISLFRTALQSPYSEGDVQLCPYYHWSSWENLQLIERISPHIIQKALTIPMRNEYFHISRDPPTQSPFGSIPIIHISLLHFDSSLEKGFYCPY